jgi:hypothetical protein
MRRNTRWKRRTDAERKARRKYVVYRFANGSSLVVGPVRRRDRIVGSGFDLMWVPLGDEDGYARLRKGICVEESDAGP